MYGSLHDNHGSVYNDAEVNGTQAHQVGPNPGKLHQNKGKKQGEGNDRGRQDAPAQASEQNNEHEHNYEGPFHQVFLHC